MKKTATWTGSLRSSAGLSFFWFPMHSDLGLLFGKVSPPGWVEIKNFQKLVWVPLKKPVSVFSCLAV